MESINENGIRKKGVEHLELWNRDDVTKNWKISKATVNYLVQTGQIPFVRIGKRSVRFVPDQLQEWLKERQGVEYRLS